MGGRAPRGAGASACQVPGPGRAFLLAGRAGTVHCGEPGRRFNCLDRFPAARGGWNRYGNGRDRLRRCAEFCSSRLLDFLTSISCTRLRRFARILSGPAPSSKPANVPRNLEARCSSTDRGLSGCLTRAVAPFASARGRALLCSSPSSRRDAHASTGDTGRGRASRSVECPGWLHHIRVSAGFVVRRGRSH